MKSLVSIFVLLILVVTAGCGDGEQFAISDVVVPVSEPTPVAGPTTGTLRIQHPLAREIDGSTILAWLRTVGLLTFSYSLRPPTTPAA